MIQINIDLAEIYELLCKKCKIKLKKLIKDKIAEAQTEQLLRQILKKKQ